VCCFLGPLFSWSWLCPSWFFRLLAFQLPVDGPGGVSAFSFVSVIALRLVLVSFLRETVAGFFYSRGWASVSV
jgi:hypothetical protein